MAMGTRTVISPDGSGVKGRVLVCGVYEILHLPTHRHYVGSSADVQGRLYWHLCMLRAGKHHCSFLQRVWNKHWDWEFGTYLLEACDVSCVISREQFYMDLTPKGLLMNTHPCARSRRGYKMSDQTRKKMSVAAKRVASDPAERQRRSERTKRMHAEGRIPPRPTVAIEPRVCKRCRYDFIPNRLPSGRPSGTLWCNVCRPPHRGGYYKTAYHN